MSKIPKRLSPIRKHGIKRGNTNRILMNFSSTTFIKKFSHIIHTKNFIEMTDLPTT